MMGLCEAVILKLRPECEDKDRINVGNIIPAGENSKGKGLETGPTLVSRQTTIWKMARWLPGSEEERRWRWDQRGRWGSDDICLDKQSGFILNAKGKPLEGSHRIVGL